MKVSQRYKHHLAGLAGIVVALFALPAIAGPVNAYNVTNANPWDVLQAYQSLEGSFASKALPIAESVFGALAAIEFAWTWVLWILEKGGGDGESVIPTLLKKIMTIGFMYFLLLNAFSGLDLIPNLIGGFEYIGAQLTGVGSTAINSTTANQAYNMLTPGGIFDTAGVIIADYVNGVETVISNLHFYQIGTAFQDVLSMVGFVGITLLVFAMLAISLSLALIESYIVLGAGVLFLAFGASRWTMPFAEKYISYAVGVGVKLFAFYLVLGIGAQLAHAWESDIINAASTGGTATSSTLTSMVLIAGIGFSMLLYGYVAMKIPSIASAFLSGAGGFMSGGDLASTVASAAAMGAAAALTGGAALGAAGAMGAGGMGMAAKGAGALVEAANNGVSALSGLASQATGAMSDAATSAMNGMADGINSLGGSGGGGPAGGASSSVAEQTAPETPSAEPEGGGVAQAVASPDAGSMPNAEQTAVSDGNVASPSSDASSLDSGSVKGMQATGQSQANAGNDASSAPVASGNTGQPSGESAQNAQEVKGQDRQNTQNTGKGDTPKGFMDRGLGEHLANAGQHGKNAANHHGNLDPAQGHGAINIHLEV